MVLSKTHNYQWTRTRSLGINLHTYNHLIFDMYDKDKYWRIYTVSKKLCCEN